MKNNFKHIRSIKPNNSILVGKVGKAYGILGWITIFSFSERKEKIFHYLPWFFCKEDKWTKVHVDDWKRYKKNFIVRIQGIFNRTEAENLTNSNIMINNHQLPELKKNEYYWFQIINFKVFNLNQEYLGKVIDLLRTKANDILVIKNEFKIYKKNIFIPFINEKIIKKIDINNKLIIAQWNQIIYYK
ncbi:16S rRNA processing protein RimM [Buchnera aphidicola (Diuraphis noxia)]|uniref:Ribosome maturation factor RimM n=1 Tax=Buchnera aphidicola subsp. Diuraphis noxia TaxID=118101 RepID=A0A1B2H8Z9_BUCDN|nr:ribosome maturation factor RimM [Buchnera aphidicola]ANZ22598.1 16S rRNA processing protein RimM [Buchnera aphidicola (Diuraphis noxia)]